MRRVRLVLTLLVPAILVLACAGPPRSPGVGPVSVRSEVPSTPTLRELFVSPDGDDSADGSRDAPFRTIGKASAEATPGTTVRVADGVYEGAVTTRASGTEEARIAFVAENAWGASIVATGTDNSAWRNEGDHVDIQGFDISGTSRDGLLQYGSYGRLLGNRVHGFQEGNCITTASSNYQLHDIDVIGNVTFGCGASHLDHGIYVSHPRGTVANNISYGNAGYGIHCWHNCNELTIANNLVFNNGDGGIVVGQGDSPNNGRVPADGMVVTNNIVVDNRGPAITEAGATGSGNRFLNNLVHGNDSNRIGLRTGQESGTVDADPQFVDYQPDGSGDYRLEPSSPAIDAGAGPAAAHTAIDGTARPQGGGIDIGVYEQ